MPDFTMLALTLRAQILDALTKQAITMKLRQGLISIASTSTGGYHLLHNLRMGSTGARNLNVCRYLPAHIFTY